MTLPNASFPRSPEAILLAVMRRDPEHSPIYHRRDLNGDGKPETMCNWFARDYCGDMSAPIPNALARDQIDWLKSPLARLDGWVYPASLTQAKLAASEGKVVLVFWRNPNNKESSHIAVMIDGLGHIAQAGRVNFNKGTVGQGFGGVAPIEFAIHP